MSRADHTEQNVPHFKFDKVRFQIVAVTLRIKSRSNMWYVLTSIVKGNNLIHESSLISTNLLYYSHFYPPLVCIGMVNFGL